MHKFQVSASLYNKKKKLFHSYFSSILYKNKKQPFESAHLIKIPENYLQRS